MIKNSVVDISRIIEHPDNYNKHPEAQIKSLRESVRTFGQVRSVVLQAPHDANGAYLCVAGNGVTEAMRREGFTEVKADIVPSDWPPHRVRAYLIADNEQAKGSDPDLEQLAVLARDIQAIEPDLLMAMVADAIATEVDTGVTGDEKPNPRKLPIDAIYTTTFPASCCLAVNSGFKIGKQSTSDPCPCVRCGVHPLTFVDNDYFNYDHEKHCDYVKQWKPKYATVMDVMTQEQCKKDNIQHHELSQILDWAEELSEHAENVIVIPKYDCIDRIPEKFMLGYSVPTSHGGTPLHVNAFRGRRVHLLGGSWKKQLAFMAVLGDDVVSFDNNYQGRIAQNGGACLPDGTRRDLPAYGIDTRINPAYIALAISLGNIGAKVNELYRVVEEPA